MTTASFRPLQGLTTEDIVSIEDKLLDGTISFSIPSNHPTNAIKLKDYCSKLKTNRTILDAMVAYCQRNDESLNDKTLTTFNILEHYGITDIIFSNFCNTVVGSTYVKGSWNTKIESLSQRMWSPRQNNKLESLSHQACGVLDKIINGSTNFQQVHNSFEFNCHFGGPGLLSTLLHSFPSQLQPILMTDLVVLDTLALKEEQFKTSYYIEFFRFFI